MSKRPKKDSMASIDPERIFELLQSLDQKVTDYQKTMSEAVSRISGLEAGHRAGTEANNHFWSTTWPAEQKMLNMMDERIRSLEQSRATYEKVDKLEARIVELGNKLDEKLNDVASRRSVEKLESRLGPLEKAETTTTAKFTITAAIFTVLGSTLVSAVVSALIRHFVG